MPRGAKRDRTATANARFEDPDSFVGQDGHEYLAGRDRSARRVEVYDRARGMCEGCAVPHLVPWSYGHMHHKQGGLVGRCDCLHNVAWVCPDYHRKQHVQVRSGK